MLTTLCLLHAILMVCLQAMGLVDDWKHPESGVVDKTGLVVIDMPKIPG